MLDVGQVTGVLGLDNDYGVANGVPLGVVRCLPVEGDGDATAALLVCRQSGVSGYTGLGLWLARWRREGCVVGSREIEAADGGWSVWVKIPGGVVG